jgi:hypothetical protein
MHGAVSNENALFRTEFNFVIVVGTEVRPAGAPKRAKEGIIRGVSKQTSERRKVVEGARRHSINKVAGSEKSLVPKTNW